MHKTRQKHYKEKLGDRVPNVLRAHVWINDIVQCDAIRWEQFGN